MEARNEQQPRRMPNFVECRTLEEANKVNLDVYRLERFSETRGVYIFVKRQLPK